MLIIMRVCKWHRLSKWNKSYYSYYNAKSKRSFNYNDLEKNIYKTLFKSVLIMVRKIFNIFRTLPNR